MQTQGKLKLIIGATAALLMSTAAHAGTRPFMPRGVAVAPPPGFADLCMRDEAACGPQDLALAQAALEPTASIMATSSIGDAPPLHIAAHGAAAPETRVLTQVQYQVLEAYSPASTNDFVPAGARSWTMSSDAPVTVAAAMPIAPQPAVNPLLRPAQMRMINTINRDVNRDVRKATDFDLYGMIEYWSLPRVINGKMYGDCEDYALEKRRRLIEAGVPAESLSMAVAVAARGSRRAVLVVSFESGDWVLDNLTPWAMPWEDMNYHWVQRQVAGSASWTTIG